MYKYFTQKKNPQIHPEVQYKIRIQINLVNDITPCFFYCTSPFAKNMSVSHVNMIFFLSLFDKMQTKKLPAKRTDS